jgi:hypothetical protein
MDARVTVMNSSAHSWETSYDVRSTVSAEFSGGSMRFLYLVGPVIIPLLQLERIIPSMLWVRQENLPDGIRGSSRAVPSQFLGLEVAEGVGQREFVVGVWVGAE